MYGVVIAIIITMDKVFFTKFFFPLGTNNVSGLGKDPRIHVLGEAQEFMTS